MPAKTELGYNRRAGYDYEIKERLQAGLVLQGWEVKALRARRVASMAGYVRVHDGRAMLIGLHIQPLANTASIRPVPDPERSRELLLRKRELATLSQALETKGAAAILVRLYINKQWIKAEIGIGTGKKQHDKRQAIAERDWNRRKAKVLRAGRER